MSDVIDSVFAQNISALKAELAEVEEFVVTNYTLADAIREGAKVSRQAHAWAESDGASCALSAAAQAGRARGYC